MSRALLALLILGASPLVLAQSIYSWKDAAGITHYSDTPPADSTSRRLKQAPLAPPPTAQDGATQSFADKELAFRKRRAEAADEVFAKHSLVEHCRQRKINFQEFQTFDDVLKQLQQKL